MKICVTGGAGFIGSHTCKELAKAGHEVIVFDNLSTGHRDFVKWGDFVHGDIRDTQKMRATLRKYQPDGIIHFAASAYVGESVLDPGKYFSNNVTGTLSILEAMRDEGISNIVVSGTCAVYGQPDVVPISESCPEHPINPYGESKLFMEKMLADFSRAHGINWISLRYFNAAGSDPDCEIGEKHDPETHLIPRVIMAALGKIPAIEIYGTDYPTPDGTCIRDYIHVVDLARAHILAANKINNAPCCFSLNLGSGKGISVNEIVNGIINICGSNEIKVNKCRRRCGDPAQLIANPLKAKEKINWTVTKFLDDILLDSYRFLKKL